MRRPELDQILTQILASQPEVSDVLFTVDRPPQVEAYGELKPVVLDPPIPKLTPFQIETIAFNIIGDNVWQIEDLIRHGSCDGSYALGEKTRFRVNVFSQRGSYSIVCRQLNAKIPSLEDLKLPDILHDIPKEKTGLVLVTGATGSGKSTTLAAILNKINRTKAVHVVTLEDPVEYLHKHDKSTFNQRELGVDFDSYVNGLRAALRQAPKVILVGEMRDRDTVKIALSAAETGHLVVSTLHTINAGETVNRILGSGLPQKSAVRDTH
jgi:twitching motility protein PilT